MAAAAASAKPKNLALLFALCGTFALLMLVQLGMFLGSGETERVRAVETGQRLTINARSGEVMGNMRTAEPAPSELPQETQPEPEDSYSEFIGTEKNTASVQSTPLSDAADINLNSLVGSRDETLDAIPIEPRTNASLTAPSQKFMQSVPEGLIPKRNGSVASLEYYHRGFTPPAQKTPYIALVISGLGASKAATEAALALPGDVSMAFDSYATHTPSWMESARNKGHEALLMLPAQPEDFPASDAGPNTILTEMAQDQYVPRLRRTLARANAYIALMLPAGEAVSDHIPTMQWLQKQADEHGLGLLVTDTPNSGPAQNLIAQHATSQRVTRIIDDSLTESAIMGSLKALEQQARNSGSAVGVLRPYPLSIKTVHAWIETLPDKGLTLVPVSALMKSQ